MSIYTVLPGFHGGWTIERRWLVIHIWNEYDGALEALSSSSYISLSP